VTHGRDFAWFPRTTRGDECAIATSVVRAWYAACVSYVLDAKAKHELEKLGLGTEVERVTASVRQNYDGEDVLKFEVVLKDELAFAKPSRQTGVRLNEIASALRWRAVRAGVPLFASVDFFAHSEVQRPKKKSA